MFSRSEPVYCLAFSKKLMVEMILVLFEWSGSLFLRDSPGFTCCADVSRLRSRRVGWPSARGRRRRDPRGAGFAWGRPAATPIIPPPTTPFAFRRPAVLPTNVGTEFPPNPCQGINQIPYADSLFAIAICHAYYASLSVSDHRLHQGTIQSFDLFNRSISWVAWAACVCVCGLC